MALELVPRQYTNKHPYTGAKTVTDLLVLLKHQDAATRPRPTLVVATPADRDTEGKPSDGSVNNTDDAGIFSNRYVHGFQCNVRYTGVMRASTLGPEQLYKAVYAMYLLCVPAVL